MSLICKVPRVIELWDILLRYPSAEQVVSGVTLRRFLGVCMTSLPEVVSRLGLSGFQALTLTFHRPTGLCGRAITPVVLIYVIYILRIGCSDHIERLQVLVFGSDENNKCKGVDKVTVLGTNMGQEEEWEEGMHRRNSTFHGTQISLGDSDLSR